MRILLALAVSLSVLSLLVAILGWGRHAEDREGVSLRPIEEEMARLAEESRGLEARVGEFSRRLASLEAGARPEGLGAEPEAKRRAAEEADSREGGQLGEIEEIAKRLGALEAKLEDVGLKANRAPVVLGGTAASETEEGRQANVSKGQAIAVDRSMSARDRLAALRELRSRGGRSKEVTQAMIDLIRDPALDSRVRADIIRNLSGVDFPELKQTLLTVLQNDTDSETRSETVETLQVFYGDPAVHAAVVQVRDHDADAEVNAEAARRLAQYEDRGQRK